MLKPLLCSAVATLGLLVCACGSSESSGGGGTDSGTSGSGGAATGGVGASGGAAAGGIGASGGLPSGGTGGGLAGGGAGGSGGLAGGGAGGSGGLAGGGVGGGGTGGIGPVSCPPPTGANYCTTYSGFDGICTSGGIAFCPKDLPKCVPVAAGGAACVQTGSVACTVGSPAQCAGNTVVQCSLDGYTESSDCAKVPKCLNPDTGKFDAPGPCKCLTTAGFPKTACVTQAAQACDPKTFARTCVGGKLRYCSANALIAVVDCGPSEVCTQAGGSAGCTLPKAAPCDKIPKCFSPTVAIECCDPVGAGSPLTCLPGYPWLEDCEVTFTNGHCSSFYKHCEA